jgi:hypothetical protein
MADIFISHTYKDRGQARMLADFFASFGWTVFWDVNT